MCTLCYDRQFQLPNRTQSDELSLLPSLQQVSFKYIDFIIKDDVITCYPNYFLPFEDIEFVKE